jgi:hypothetical protein
VIATKQKRHVRKMMFLFYGKRTIPIEKCPAKKFKTQAAKIPCPEPVVRAMPAVHPRQDIKQMADR